MLLMPRAHNIHYKSAFDIKHIQGTGTAKIRDEIRAWLMNHPVTKQSSWKFKQSWFDFGDTEQLKVGEGHIRIAVNKGQQRSTDPEHWAIEFIHGDSAHHSRLWCTEIGLTRKDKDSVRLACMLKHGIIEGWVGELPPAPVFSVPKLIKNIVSNYQCYKENTKIQSSSKECFIDDVDLLANLVIDKSRILPLVISVTNESGSAPVDIVDLYNAVTGNANAYQISSDSVHNFNNYMPEKMVIKPGMLRIYSRYNSLESNYRRHRYYTRYKIDEIGSDALFDQVGIALARNSKTFVASEVIRIKDVIHERTYNRLRELQESSNENKSEYESLLQERINFLTKEIEVKVNEANQYVEMYDEIENDYKNAKAKIYRLENDAQYNPGDFEFDCLSELPRDICECMKILSGMFSDKIIIHERAYDTASNFSGNDNINCIRCAWKMIFAAATTLHKIVFLERSSNIENEFINRTGIDFSMNEGSQTKKDKSLMRLRSCEYGGQKYEFLPHMKGKKSEDFLRIHVTFVNSENKILICHCGEHIDTYGTQRR